MQKLGIKELPSQLAYRFVSFDYKEEVNSAIQQASINGGKNPTDTRVGMCVSVTDKALDIAKVDLIQNNKPGVLFIYDNSKFQPLSKVEIEADKSLIFSGGYGVKPIEGLRFKDSVVGMIRLENPGVKRILTNKLV